MIWESEISTLQDHKIKAAGSPLPLGEARVDALDFPVEKVKYVATGGDISKEGVLKLKDISQSQLEYLAESSEEASLEELREAWIRGDYASQKQETPMDETDGEYQNPDSKVNTGDGSSSTSSNNGYLLALGGLLFLVFTVAFFLLRRKRKAQSTLQETKKIQENQKLGQEKAKLEEVGQTKGNSSQKYDKSIIATKSLNEEDNQGEKNMEQTDPSYCKYCGEAFKRKDALFCRSCGRKRK